MKVVATIAVISCLLIIVIVIVVLVLGSFYFYRLAVSRRSKSFLTGNADLIEVPHQQNPWLEKQGIEDVEMVTFDGLLLKGHWLSASKPSGKTAIIAHGYSGHGMQMDSLAKLYHQELEYNVLLPDNRGHGESEGTYIGFGWDDRKDYVKWIEYVIKRQGESEQIVLHGVSMGGATVLMTSGELLPEQVKGIVSDCAYTSVEEELRYQLKRMFSLPAFPFLQLTSLLTKFRAGYDFKEASALKQVAKADKPILFIHGDMDTFVPTSMVYPLYDRCSSQKELLVVPGAGHGLAYFTDPAAYGAAVRSFLQRWVAG